MTVQPVAAPPPLTHSVPPKAPTRGVPLRLVPPLGTELIEQALVHRAQRFGQAVVEVVEGNRSPSQLLPCTSPRVYAAVVLRIRISARRRHTRNLARSTRARVMSVRVSQPRVGVAEVAARVQHGARSHALAFRLELRDCRWVCTALEWADAGQP